MGEVDVDYFRRPKQEHPLPANVDSIDAPSRPLALLAGAPPKVDSLDGDVYVPSRPVEINLPLPLRKFDVDNVESRQDLFMKLLPTLPLNEYHLPKYVYRPDVLDHRALQQAVRAERSAALHLTLQPPKSGPPNTVVPESEIVITSQELLDSAIEPLEYYHGYPTLQDGTAFWEKLPYETTESYSAFTRYLEQIGARTVDPVASDTGFPKSLITEWFHLYFWQFRARAWDMFQAAHADRVRIQRIMRTNDTHFLEAERVFKKLQNTLSAKTEEEWQEVKITDLVGLMEKVQRIGRTALGIAAPTAQAPQSVNVEVSMKRLAQLNGEEQKVSQEDDMTQLLQNPEALVIAQDLLVKVNGGK